MLLEPNASKFMNGASYLGFFWCCYERTITQLYKLCITFVFISVVILNVRYSFYELCIVFLFISDKILKVLIFSLYVVHIIF